MIIRFSRYYLPFRERGQSGVYYIPRDYHSDILAGRHDGHVKRYRYLFPVDVPYSPPEACVLPMSDLESKELDDLFFDFGVKAAGRRSGRLV